MHSIQFLSRSVVQTTYDGLQVVYKHRHAICIGLLIVTIITCAILSQTTANPLLLRYVEQVALVIGVFSPKIKWNMGTQKVEAGFTIKGGGGDIVIERTVKKETTIEATSEIAPPTKASKKDLSPPYDPSSYMRRLYERR